MNHEIVLEGERLFLREFRDEDFEAVHAYVGDPEVIRFLPWGPSLESDTREFLDRAQGQARQDPRTDYMLAVVLRDGERVIGGIGLHLRGPQAMLGYCYDRRAWGQGYATEAGRLLLDHAFRRLKLHRVWAGCDPENHGSIRVLEKLGMRREGCLREETLIRGEWRDSLVFAVLDWEWGEAQGEGGRDSGGERDMAERGLSEGAPRVSARSLDEEREEFRRRRFLAMPLAGVLAWTLAAVAGALLNVVLAAWALFILTGSIAYVGIFLSRFTGEDFLARDRPKNTLDVLFFQSVFQALLVFGIAIPFFLQDPTSLPLSVGILTGLMWAPVSWMIRHWVGLFHATARTLLVVLTWYALPGQRFVAVPLVVVAIYLATIAILETRWRALPDPATA